MPKTYRLTRAIVLAAFLALLVAGVLIGRGFALHVTEPCKGRLVNVPLEELGDLTHAEHVSETDVDLAIKVDRFFAKATTHEKARIAWNRPGDMRACSDLAIPRDDSRSTDTVPALELRRDRDTGVFVLGREPGDTFFAFRKSEQAGRVFRRDRILEPNNVGALVFLASLGALALAVGRILQARPYATRLRFWQSGTLRADGLVESPNGASLGRIGARIYIKAGDVIVDPASFEGRDVYREMPMLARKDIAAGSHERWTAGTLRRLRDARTLAVLATATTGLAVAAHFLSA